MLRREHLCTRLPRKGLHPHRTCAARRVKRRYAARPCQPPRSSITNCFSLTAKYVAHYTSPTFHMATALLLKISPYRRSQEILKAARLADAVRGCDTYARDVVKGNLVLGLLRTARWRMEPATPAQRNFILKKWRNRKMFSTSEGQEATEIALKTMRKGETHNIMTRLKHGAQVCPTSWIVVAIADQFTVSDSVREEGT